MEEIENSLMILFLSDCKIISQVEEIAGEIGDPNCKLTEPFVINNDDTLTPWMVEYTDQNTFMIHSDKILTIMKPKQKYIEKYKSLLE
jgi:glycine cleavage system H lipoate-binding protein